MTDPTERWLPVTGYEGLYEVSDLGRVRSLDRFVYDTYRGKPRRRAFRGRILKHIDGPGGYPVVGLSKDGRERMRQVHRLVLDAFTGSRPLNLVSRHGPGGRADARLVNLRYGTPSENESDKVRDGTTDRGEQNPNARLTWGVVLDIRRRVAEGEKQRDVAMLYGIHFAYLNLIVHRKRWAYPPEQW